MREFAIFIFLLILSSLFLIPFMKKLLILSLVLVMSSCSLFNKKPQSFEDYYARNVTATIDSLDRTIDALGLLQSVQSRGVFDALVSIPVLLSGSIRTDYRVESTGRNASLELQNPTLQYEWLAGSGMLALDRLGLISHDGDLYLEYKNLRDIGFSTEEIRAVFGKFDGKWLSWTQADARNEVMTAEEKRALEMADNLQKMDMDKIKKYLLTYPIWKSTEDLGMSGALQMYRVELDREKVVGLIQAINQDLSGAPLTESELASLQSDIAKIQLSGTMWFHTDNTDESLLDLSLRDESGTAVANIVINSTPTNILFALSDPSGDSVVVRGTLTRGTPKTELNITLTQSGTEMGKLAGYIDMNGRKLRELSLDITAQGITATLKHTQKDDGAFDGRLLLPVGSLSWEGAIENKALTALKIQWASPMGNMNMNLVSSGTMVAGPLSVMIDTEEILRANIGLLARDDAFRLVVDIPQGTGSTEMIHGELGWTMDRASFAWDVEAPTSTTPLQELLTELEKVTPEEFEDDVPMDDVPFTEDELMMNELDTLEPQLQ